VRVGLLEGGSQGHKMRSQRVRIPVDVKREAGTTREKWGES